MKFLDQAKIYVKSGDGGRGCLSFRREKYIEFGGPDGGNGGKGGDVVFVAANDMNTLIDFRYQQHYKAKNGKGGEGRNKTGAGGEDMIIKVPVGTVILAEDKETELADMTEEGQRLVLLKGGDGGKGNAHYKSSTNQAPRKTTPGFPGIERELWLRLKLIADAGIVGLPNAGKSTFIAAVSGAKPKIADYPFTTLVPNLGVVRLEEGTSFVLADIPGLIEGASDGHGLGDRFLGHVERCSVLLHMIDITQDDVVGAYRTIREELKNYDDGLAQKEEVITLNKIDALSDEDIKEKQKALGTETGKDIHLVSAVSGQHTKDVLFKLYGYINPSK